MGAVRRGKERSTRFAGSSTGPASAPHARRRLAPCPAGRPPAHLVTAPHARPLLLLAALVFGGGEVAQELHGGCRHRRGAALRLQAGGRQAGGLQAAQACRPKARRLCHARGAPRSCCGHARGASRSCCGGMWHARPCKHVIGAPRCCGGGMWHACKCKCAPRPAGFGARRSLRAPLPARPSPAPPPPRRRRLPNPATRRAAPSRSRPSTHRSDPPGAGRRAAGAGSGCAAPGRWGTCGAAGAEQRRKVSMWAIWVVKQGASEAVHACSDRQQ